MYDQTTVLLMQWPEELLNISYVLPGAVATHSVFIDVRFIFFHKINTLHAKLSSSDVAWSLAAKAKYWKRRASNIVRM